MADLVLAMGTSHSPMLGSPAADILVHAERDRTNPGLLNKEGAPTSYAALAATADPAIAAQLAPEIIEDRTRICRESLDRLGAALAEARPDAVIVIGDDQREQFHDDNMPAMLIYRGDTIANFPSSLPADAPQYWHRARAQYFEPRTPRDYPVDAGLARHLIESLIADGFDISQSNVLPRQRGEGHAFGFVHRRLMKERVVPLVPVMLNTYYPPNQPSPARCHALGRAIAAAVARWPGGKRIAVVASGGLSHFTVDEELDTAVLDAISDGDGAPLSGLPREKLNSGNSEIRNWIAMAGAARELQTEWREYVPFYRSPAGTGCGMAFGVWQ